jgi:hypothetical protein
VFQTLEATREDGTPTMLSVYVVDIKTMPKSHIVGTGIEQYYAQALDQAIREGLIDKPGKYAIWVDFDLPGHPWKVFEVIE